MPFNIAGDWIPEKEPPKTHSRPVKVIKERRGNSIVTIILNLPLNSESLKKLCSNLKQRLGCGGTVQEDKIEIQGDKIEQVKPILKDSGIKVL
ncbi:MAG: translation initiation factor [Parachlamydiaceae bacterium]|nr:translation initiation factor [Parachlamydiaceae bacterium]